MKTVYTIEVTPNRDRGYDGRVLLTVGGETMTLTCDNAPSETRARELAEARVVIARKTDRARRKPTVSERDAETAEARRNERDYI